MSLNNAINGNAQINIGIINISKMSVIVSINLLLKVSRFVSVGVLKQFPPNAY